MSDSDDWEKELDSDHEEEQKKKEQEEAAKKKAEFEDEDKVDAEKKKKQLEKEAAEKAQKELDENKRTKKSNKVDYDAAFEKRQQALAGIKPTEETKVDTKNMSKGGKGMLIEMDAEKGLADQLFGGLDADAPVGKISLNSEKEYKQFGQKTGQLLYQGSAPYRVENFFRELCKDLPEHCDSKQIQKIVEHLSIMQKKLAKDEKVARDGKNKKPTKAKLAGGGGKAGDMLNNNTAMINDVMGVTDDYGDYGAETGDFKRENEAEYDFM